MSSESKESIKWDTLQKRIQEGILQVTDSCLEIQKKYPAARLNLETNQKILLEGRRRDQARELFDQIKSMDDYKDVRALFMNFVQVLENEELMRDISRVSLKHHLKA